MFLVNIILCETEEARTPVLTRPNYIILHPATKVNLIFDIDYCEHFVEVVLLLGDEFIDNAIYQFCDGIICRLEKHRE